MSSSEYTGPDYCTVKALDEFVWEVRTNRGEKIGTYPNADLARRVATANDKRMLREYLRGQRKCA